MNTAAIKSWSCNVGNEFGIPLFKTMVILFLTFLPHALIAWDNFVIKEISWYYGLTFALIISAIYSILTPSFVSVVFNKDHHIIYKGLVAISTITVTGLMIKYISSDNIEFNPGIVSTLLILLCLSIIFLFLCLKIENNVLDKIKQKDKSELNKLDKGIDKLMQKHNKLGE